MMVLGPEAALYRRMQLHDVPFWLLNTLYCEEATVWMKFQNCLKEMPSPSATPILRIISFSPWSVPAPYGNNRVRNEFNVYSK